MMQLPAMPVTNLAPGQQRCGFTVDQVTPIAELGALAIELHHSRSGAKLLHVLADDPENLIGIAFRTPPIDDTGLPHILEHTVLCGSKRFPVKDPFVEMVKTSLATFINAMTYPDKTVYPVSSMVEVDFFNLARVYCDAVFAPMITEKHFKQEGHHFDFAEPGNPESPLVIKGIVYNEMKGAYSDLDGIIFRDTKTRLSPDNAYGFDSGGDPRAIPQLTYDSFVRYYKTYYHPSNARIFVYGNIATEKHLKLLDEEYLSGFTALAVDTAIAPQPRWDQPRISKVPYPVGPSEETAGKTAIVATYLTNDLTDAVTSLAMNVLDYYLLGNAASPLRKALVDSKLGEELTSSGYADYQRDTYFTVGLKGSEPDRLEAMAKLIVDVCRQEIDRGLDDAAVDAAFHKLELATRQIGSRYPLRLMGRVYDSWMYDGDPLYHLRINRHLAQLREKVKADDTYLRKLLRTMIVENRHCTLTAFVPDQNYFARQNSEAEARLAEAKKAMPPEQLQRIVREAEELDAMQSEPNSPEALATLPRLTLADVPEKPIELSTELHEEAGLPLLRTEAFSNGINYLHLALNLDGLDDDLLDYLPLYTDAVEKMGAAGQDYAAMAQRQAACCGGFALGASLTGRVDDPGAASLYLYLGSSALTDRTGAMLELLTDRVLHAEFDDLERYHDVVMQGRIGRRSGVIPGGSAYAAGYAARHLWRGARLRERLDGVEQLRHFENLAKQYDTQRDESLDKLRRIHAYVTTQAPMVGSFVGEDAAFKQVVGHMARFDPARRGSLRAPVAESPVPLPGPLPREGLATPADVAFVARAMRAVPMSDPLSPALLVLAVHLRYGFLWDQIRVKGGAYGAHATYSTTSGIFSFASYRDPNIKSTLEAYRQVFDYVVTKMDTSDEAVGQAVIGSMKSLDAPIRPTEAAGVALARYLTGETPAIRRDFRARLLAVRGADLRAAAGDILQPEFETSPICVLSSREKLEAANQTLGDLQLEISDLY